MLFLIIIIIIVIKIFNRFGNFFSFYFPFLGVVTVQDIIQRWTAYSILCEFQFAAFEHIPHYHFLFKWFCQDVLFMIFYRFPSSLLTPFAASQTGRVGWVTFFLLFTCLNHTLQNVTLHSIKSSFFSFTLTYIYTRKQKLNLQKLYVPSKIL